MRYFRVLVLGGFLFFSVQTAHAQATIDVLRDLDRELKAKAEPGEEAAAEGELLEQLAENIGGKVRLRGRMFTARPELAFMGFNATRFIEVDRRSTFGEAMIELDTHTGKKDIWRLNLSAWAEYGNDRDRWAGTFKWMQDDYHRSNILELNEMYLTLFQDTFNFTAGKKILRNGISTIYSPANRYTSGDINDPLYPKEFGIWQGKVDVAAGTSTTISGAILPVYERPKIPGAQSRWFGASEDFDFRLVEIPDWVTASLYQQEKVGIEMDNVSYLASIKSALDGWDVFASAYHGNNPYFTFDGAATGTDALLTKKICRVNNFAAGFSTTHKQVEFHGEALYNDSCANRDDDYVNGVVGMTCTSSKFRPPDIPLRNGLRGPREGVFRWMRIR